MSGFSLRGAIDAKCRDCGGQEGGDRYWRLHTSACPVVACPLWPVRPIATRNAPAWLASRKVDDLPAGFAALPQEQAIAIIRGVEAVLQAEKGGNSELAAAQALREGVGL